MSLKGVIHGFIQDICGLQDFRKISSHLRDRSVGDCVRFYYRNQKLDEFAALRRKQQLKKRRLQTQEKSRQYLGGRGGSAAQGAYQGCHVSIGYN